MSDERHFPDPDDLLQFASESDPDFSTSTDARASDRDRDWLSIFAAEPMPEVAQLSSERVAVPQAQLAPHLQARTIVWSRPTVMRLLAASVVAFVAGGVSVLWVLHLLGAPANPDLAGTVSTPVQQGISTSMLRQFDQVAIVAPTFSEPSATSIRSLPLPIATSGAVTPRPSAKAREIPLAPGRVATAARPESAPTAGASALTFPIIPGGAGDELLPDKPRASTSTSAGLMPPLPNRPDTSVEQSAVRQALDSYEAAYEGLNVAATAEVWPTVDRRALSRAFDTLKSQGLDFESCAITVADARATATCRGTVQFVRKVGNALPLTSEGQWVFKMRRLAGGWKIDEVAATQTPILAAQRVRGEE